MCIVVRMCVYTQKAFRKYGNHLEKFGISCARASLDVVHHEIVLTKATPDISS